MECHVVSKWETRTYELWLFQLDGIRRTTRVFQFTGPDERKFEEVAEGEKWPDTPTLVLHREELEAFAKALSDHLPPSDSQAAHLKDAIGVRDRLLTIVEEAK